MNISCNIYLFIYDHRPNITQGGCGRRVHERSTLIMLYVTTGLRKGARPFSYHIEWGQLTQHRRANSDTLRAHGQDSSLRCNSHNGTSAMSLPDHRSNSGDHSMNDD
jgi:hypothetical protein